MRIKTKLLYVIETTKTFIRLLLMQQTSHVKVSYPFIYEIPIISGTRNHEAPWWCRGEGDSLLGKGRVLWRESLARVSEIFVSTTHI